MKVSEIGQIYTCQKCRNEVIITRVGGGELKCCDQKMVLAEDDWSTETEEYEETEE